MSKLPLWQKEWDKREYEWDEKAKEAAETSPLRKLAALPQMVGITKETAKGLKWKSLKWIIAKDRNRKILKGFLRHPFAYGWSFLKSSLQRKPYKREGDFFLYGVDSIAAFEDLLGDPKALFVVGFSYCHKPFECPAGRFSSCCICDTKSAVCRQCFIGKAVHLSASFPLIPLFIPTIHYIGEKIFEIVHANPGVPVLFMITACELTLEMFGDLGNMVGLKGVGVRLDGRICNTMKAFELSEQGIKPGLTIVLPETQKKMLALIRKRAFKSGPE